MMVEVYALAVARMSGGIEMPCKGQKVRETEENWIPVSLISMPTCTSQAEDSWQNVWEYEWERRVCFYDSCWSVWVYIRLNCLQGTEVKSMA